jgi:hypothetical protein
VALRRRSEAYCSGLKGKELEELTARIKKGLNIAHGIKKRCSDEYTDLVDDEKVRFNTEMIEAAWDDLPQMYYIATRHRAIVATPFFLPRPGTDVFAGTVRSRPVQMLGYETRDVHVVDTVTP